MSQLAEPIRSFILNSFLFGQTDYPLAADDSLLENGIMDSTGVLELISFLEQQFGIQVEDRELVPENLDSLDRLVAFVQRKKAGEQAVNPPSSEPSKQ